MCPEMIYGEMTKYPWFWSFWKDINVPNFIWTFLCAPHPKARPIIPPLPVLIFCYLNLPNKSFLSTHFNSCCSSQPVSGLSPKPWGAVNGFRVATQTQIPMETKGLRKQKKRNRQPLPDLLCSLSKFFLLSAWRQVLICIPTGTKEPDPSPATLKFLKNLSTLL